jgi:hypothetical protein
VISPDVARLAGAFTVLSQGAATLVLGVAPTALRIVVAVVFLSAGTAPLARSEAAVPAAGVASLTAAVWSVYAVSTVGASAAAYEVPVLGLLGAALLAYSSRSEVE